jgi:dihydroorotate dehydrogenase
MYGLLYRVVLRRLPAEGAHRAGFWVIRAVAGVPGGAWVLRRWLGAREPVLRVRALGMEFAGPVGLAAGFDKDARGVAGLGALGFGFVEVGTVTARAQAGNDRPRLFRLTADRALVNRMGFNNEGAVAAAARLGRVRGGRARRGGALAGAGRGGAAGAGRGGAAGAGRGGGGGAGRGVIVGVNIGKSRVVAEEGAAADYAASARAVAGVADYVVVNVSSPNTPGLRDLQAVGRLRPVLVAVREALDAAAGRRVPLLVKIGPDLADADVDAVADLALELGLDGIVATNTTVSRDGLASSPRAVAAAGAGGLSGAPLRGRALEVLRLLHARGGGRLVLIAVGGIESPDDAWERLRAGATLVQGYTGFIYGGPLWPRRMHEGLARRARAAGLASIEEAAGLGAGPGAGGEADRREPVAGARGEADGREPGAGAG